MFDRDVQGLKQEGVKAAVVGGGITAAHYAIKLSDDGRDVTMFVRHPFRTYDFDSDPGWLGPKYMKRFSKTSDYQKKTMDHKCQTSRLLPEGHLKKACCL